VYQDLKHYGLFISWNCIPGQAKLPLVSEKNNCLKEINIVLSYLIHIELAAECVELGVQVLEHVDHHHRRRC